MVEEENWKKLGKSREMFFSLEMMTMIIGRFSRFSEIRFATTIAAH